MAAYVLAATVHVVPDNVPPLGQEYVVGPTAAVYDVAATVQLVPERVAPVGHEYVAVVTSSAVAV